MALYGRSRPAAVEYAPAATLPQPITSRLEGELAMPHNLFNSLQQFKLASGKTGQFYSLPRWRRRASAESRGCRSRSASCSNRCCATATASRSPRRTCAAGRAGSRRRERTDEIPFVVARIVLQDFTGVPLLVDLAAMRDAAQQMGKRPEDHRAAGAGRPRHRPLGAGRSLRQPGRARAQHGDRVQAQPRALPVPEVGHAGLRRPSASCRPASASCIR